MTRPVRVRFAPSPTGPLHIGGVRTALYNYLFARRHKGTFILRIEDTDQTRYVPGAEQYIIDSLRWAGLTIDEGVQEGGTYGPYRQSERKAIYRQYAEELVSVGKAYYAFDTPEELDAWREERKLAGDHTPKYDSHTRTGMRNALTMTHQEVQDRIAAGDAYVIRAMLPADETITFTDAIRGEVSFQASELDDKVLYKSDGMPTYHLANVVDDFLMQISHVIRGEEWLPSTPLHVFLYQSFGWSMPEFAHLPLILKPEGKGKLSKRDGDRLGFPVFPLQWQDPESGEISSGYREDGYFPDAFINMLALLGWNPGSEQELFSLDELAAVFSLDRVGKSGARFDPDKAKWFNAQYLHKRDGSVLAYQLQDFIETKYNHQQLSRICDLMKERCTFVKDIPVQGAFFFTAPETLDKELVKKMWKADESPGIVTDLMAAFRQQEWRAAELEATFKQYLEGKGLGLKSGMAPLRLLLTGMGGGPGLFDTMEVLGQQECLQRLEKGLQQLAQ